MLIEKNYVIKIEDKELSKKRICEKCKFVDKLVGIYFFDDDSTAEFDAKIDGNKMYLYCRSIRRTFFNPLIIIEFSRKYLSVKIRYNMVNSITILLLTVIFMLTGIVGMFGGYVVLFYLPLIVFWCLIAVSFCIFTKKIIKNINSILS